MRQFFEQRVQGRGMYVCVCVRERERQRERQRETESCSYSCGSQRWGTRTFNCHKFVSPSWWFNTHMRSVIKRWIRIYFSGGVSHLWGVVPCNMLLCLSGYCNCTSRFEETFRFSGASFFLQECHNYDQHLYQVCETLESGSPKSLNPENVPRASVARPFLWLSTVDCTELKRTCLSANPHNDTSGHAFPVLRTLIMSGWEFPSSPLQ